MRMPMALCRFRAKESDRPDLVEWGWLRNGRIYPLAEDAVNRCFSSPDANGIDAFSGVAGESLAVTDVVFAAPLDVGQEVWAAGVTYESSKFARMAESAEGGDFYAKVYVADRPELFFKATPGRTVGPG